MQSFFGSLPGSDSPGMQTIRPTLGGGSAKRELGTESGVVSVDLGNVLSNKIMRTSFNGNARSVGAFSSALPGGMASSISVTDSGFSTSDQQPDEIITEPLVIRPWLQHGWEQTYIEGTSLFVNLAEPWNGNSKGMHAVASVPVLNYFSERAARAGSGTRQQARYGAAKRAGPGNVNHYSAKDADDFDKKWAYTGTMTSDMKGEGPWRTRERMIGVSVFKRVPKLFNLFGEDVRPGDRLYFVTRKYAASSSSFIAPDGTTQEQYTSFPEPYLQTHGATDKGYGFLAHCSEHPGLVSDGEGPSETLGDVDYWDGEARLANEYTEFEWDEERDTFMAVVRNIADQEGAQEAVNSAPELVYRAYTEGTTKYVGVVKSVYGHSPSSKMLADAHRSIPVMQKLQTLEIWAGV